MRGVPYTKDTIASCHIESHMNNMEIFTVNVYSENIWLLVIEAYRPPVRKHSTLDKFLRNKLSEILRMGLELTSDTQWFTVANNNICRAHPKMVGCINLLAKIRFRWTESDQTRKEASGKGAQWTVDYVSGAISNYGILKTALNTWRRMKPNIETFYRTN